MDGSNCAGCRERDARIAQLEAEVADLRKAVADLAARLGTNATNSSLPPSANPLDAPKPLKKKKSKKRRGGQKGHPPHLRQLLPSERVSKFVPLVPGQCENCAAPLSAEAQPNDPPPHRFQSIELRPIVTEVTEYQGQARTCTCCGHVTTAVIPADVRAHSIGPRLSATLSYFTGCHGMSKRAVEETSEAIFQAPVAVGTVCNLEQEMSAALATPHEEALQAVRAAAVKGADETSWKIAGKKCWLWAAATANVAAFVIHLQRGALGFKALLGEVVLGVLCSDRWTVYNAVPEKRRQVCWAHLKRDFQKIIDRDGPSVWVGRRGRRLVKKVFAVWHAYRDGQVTREQMQGQIQKSADAMNRLLVEGQFVGTDPQVGRFCANLLEIEAALWTFTRVEGVEPTNNHMERLLRRAVLWRRRSFGCASARGCRFVERILTAVQTRRLQGQDVLSYLHEALVAHRAGRPAPSLLT
jgi:transposase